MGLAGRHYCDMVLLARLLACFCLVVLQFLAESLYQHGVSSMSSKVTVPHQSTTLTTQQQLHWLGLLGRCTAMKHATCRCATTTLHYAISGLSNVMLTQGSQ